MERRQYPRVKVDCPVDIVVNSRNHHTLALSGKTIDLSEGGICFELEEPLPLDERSSIFSKIDIYPQQIEAYVELIWNQPLHDQQKFRYGGRFVEVEEDQKLRLKNVIGLSEQFIIERLTPIMQMIDRQAELMKQRVSAFFLKENSLCLKEFIDLEMREYNKDTLGDLRQRLDYLVSQGNNIENFINNKVITKEIKQQFRSMLGNWLYQSYIMKHALDKPHGYPGDYKLLEIIYDNNEISEGYAKYFDRYFLDNPYAVAVRNRKNLMRKILNDFIMLYSQKSRIEILNLASGSCREILELLEDGICYSGQLVFSCVDFDDEALMFSKKIFENVAQNIKVNMIKENILNLGNKPDHYFPIFNGKDLVYSIGLADYLPDRVLRKIIQFSYSILNPGGKLIIAFKDRDKNRNAPLPPDWYCDWTFVPRNKCKVLELIEECKLGNPPLELRWEESGVIFFVSLAKV